MTLAYVQTSDSGSQLNALAAHFELIMTVLAFPLGLVAVEQIRLGEPTASVRPCSKF